MDKKEEELLSMHYQMEKTDIKQQRFEDQLLSISNDLRKSKRIRNFYFAFIIFLILLITGGSLLFMQRDSGISIKKGAKAEQNEITQLLIANDSLQRELDALKQNLSKYENLEKQVNLDSINNNIDIGTKIVNTNNVINESVKKSTKSKSSRYKQQHCYISRAYKSNGAIFIEADVIEYYQGKKAVKKAREYGKAEYDIDNNGDTLYFLYNNYYIHNQSSTVKVLELDEKVRVKIKKINQISNSFSLKALQKVILDKPILIIEIDDGIVYKITEQKLP